MKYQMDHVVFDEFGLVSVHCIACNHMIRKRVEAPSKRDPSKMVYAMMTLSNYRELERELSDGSKMYPMFCVECFNEPIDDEKTMGIIKRGWSKEMRHAGRPEETIKRTEKEKESLRIVKGGK